MLNKNSEQINLLSTISINLGELKQILVSLWYEEERSNGEEHTHDPQLITSLKERLERLISDTKKIQETDDKEITKGANPLKAVSIRLFDIFHKTKSDKIVDKIKMTQDSIAYLTYALDSSEVPVMGISYANHDIAITDAKGKVSELKEEIDAILNNL